MSRIVVLGSANMDLVVRQPRRVRPGETMFGSSFTSVPGGKGLNQAVAAARAGADVGFLGAVGCDAYGGELIGCLEREGIDISGIARVAGSSGTAHIAVLDDGENSIVVVPGANAAVDHLDESSRGQIDQARYLVAQFERPLELVRQAFLIARAQGVVTVLTPAPVVANVDDLLALTDVLVLNAEEARELARQTDPLDAAMALSLIAGLVVMTQGAEGAVIAGAGQIVATVAPRKVEPVDTTAAGDTFVGVLVARMAAGDELAVALAAATVGASIAVTRAGASSSMPDWAEISALLPPR